MHTDEIRTLRNAKPFSPFTVHTADGRKFTVARPEHVGFSFDRQSLCIAMRGGGFTHFDLRLATRAERTARPARRKR
jgi:hypothetical protein